jgi:UDP-glucose 4-epimerase
MREKQVVLVTGGAGYIGSHTVLQLLEQGYAPVVVDNLSNSSQESLRRVASLAGAEVPFHQVDLLDKAALAAVVEQYRPSSCIHFAGLKAVGESAQIPLAYYHNNITGTLMLLEVLTEYDCKQVVFSSSATVYGAAEEMPLTEDSPLGATNPYGRTKLYIESVLSDACAADEALKVVCLRYFNPVGGHPSGNIGEDPSGIPNNLMPFITQVAVGRRPHLNVFGDDYPTPDGTGIRDYIHVVDLAAGHLAALRAMDKVDGWEAVNLGTGKGVSVLQMVAAVEKASGRPIPYEIQGRRAGDVAVSFADPFKAQSFLGWKAECDLDAMCSDAWNWQEQNPQGYGE